MLVYLSDLNRGVIFLEDFFNSGCFFRTHLFRAVSELDLLRILSNRKFSFAKRFQLFRFFGLIFSVFSLVEQVTGQIRNTSCTILPDLKVRTKTYASV